MVRNPVAGEPPPVFALGILGGSFDPVHIAHLVVAERVREALALDRVLLVPAARQPLKEEEPRAPAEHRLAMLRLAVEGNPTLAVDPLEILRGGTSYTVDTLEALACREGPAELYLILGSDAYRLVDRWRRIDRIRRLARIVVVPRRASRRAGAAGVGEPAGTGAEPAGRAVGEGQDDLTVVVPGLDVSASDIRERVALGVSIRYLVPEPVLAYIEERGLYRG